VQWRNRLGALLLGTVTGFLVLEAGLAFFTDVDTYWFPGQARLILDQGKALCYSPGLSVELPLDANREEDRQLLLDRTRKWHSDGRPLSLERLLDLAPHCVIVDERVRERGPAPDRLHVVPIFGDSFAFGHGLPHEFSVSGFLVARDRQRNFPIFARPGNDLAGIGLQEKQFRRKALEHGWTSTEALYLYNVDDVLVPNPLPPKLAALSRRDGQELNSGIPESRSFWDRLARHSRAYRVVLRRLQEAEITASTLEFYNLLYDDSIPDDGRQRSREFLRSLNQTLGAAGIRLHVVLYPVLTVDDGGAYPLKGVHQTLLKWCAEDGISCHDAASAVLGTEGAEGLILHPRDRHPNDVANGRMAQYILDEVLAEAVKDGR
jgi:hypothetical protein